MKYKVEICANSVQSALNAEAGGAHRVELCDNLWEGGTTPSMATIELTKRHLSIPVFVLIRPRGGDFVYTDLEFEIIKRDIELAKEKGVDGIVSGVLSPDGSVDIERTKELVELAKPLPFTFHRAFDLTPDPIQALEDIISCGAHRILTSGQTTSAPKGAALIKRLIKEASDRIIILPGGGINDSNINTLIDAGCHEFHLSAKAYKKGLAQYSAKVPMNSSTDIPEDRIAVSDIEKIKKVLHALS